jgi:hypothetical protein
MAAYPANHGQDFHVTGIRKIPLDKSELDLALRTSLVCIRDWNGVSRAESSGQKTFGRVKSSDAGNLIRKAELAAMRFQPIARSRG